MLEYQHESSFKKFQSAIQKILATFDSIDEWADIITFLTKLTKVGYSGTRWLDIDWKILRRPSSLLQTSR